MNQEGVDEKSNTTKLMMWLNLSKISIKYEIQRFDRGPRRSNFKKYDQSLRAFLRQQVEYQLEVNSMEIKRQHVPDGVVPKLIAQIETIADPRWKQEWTDAVNKEIDSYRSMGVYREIHGSEVLERILRGIWVFTIKKDGIKKA